MHTPRKPHLEAALSILRYLKVNPGKMCFDEFFKPTQTDCLCRFWLGRFPSNSSLHKWFLYLSWIYSCFMENKNAKCCFKILYWSRVPIYDSSYMWITMVGVLLADFGLNSSTPRILYCDNQVVLHIATNPVFHERTKHIELDCHFIREKIQKDWSKHNIYIYISTLKQVADIFTKPSASEQFDCLVRKSGMSDIHASTWGGVLWSKIEGAIYGAYCADKLKVIHAWSNLRSLWMITTLHILLLFIFIFLFFSLCVAIID